jgi:hypothetical protein
MIYAYAASILLLGLGTQLAFALLDHRDRRRQVRRSVNLAAGIADERRNTEDEPTEEIVLDPPVTRLYVDPGMALFRGRLVHVRCLDPYLRHDARPCGDCAGHLDQVLTGAN